MMRILTRLSFCLTILACVAATSQTSAELPSLLNGSMAEGDTEPSHWAVRVDEGQVRLVRDTKRFDVGPASMRIEAVDGMAKGGATQRLTAKPGQTFALTGRAMTQGDVSLAVVALLTPGAENNWTQIARFEGSEEWVSFSSNVTIPADGTAPPQVRILMHGSGMVWVDDLRIEPAVDLAAEASPLISDFARGFTYTNRDFRDKVQVVDGIATIDTDHSRGAAGMDQRMDLSRFGSWSPAIWVKLGKDNAAHQLRVSFVTPEVRRVFSYRLEDASADAYTRLLPIRAMPVSATAAGLEDDGFDPSQITQYQVMGEWSRSPTQLSIQRIELVEPDEAMLGERDRVRRQEQRRAAERAEAAREAQQRRESLLAGGNHDPSGPSIEHVGLVGPDILALEIQAGHISLRQQVPYKPIDGDVIKTHGQEVLIWDGDRIVRTEIHHAVHRAGEDGEPELIGLLATNAGMLWPAEKVEGDPLATETVDLPEAYTIESADDANYARPLHPEAVFRKSTPNDYTHPAFGRDPTIRHIIYLKLPTPLEEGKTYQIRPVALNTRQEKVRYTHKPRSTRSEAIHTSHIGYRPDDPFKRAFLSVWLGSGGAYRQANEENLRFHLICEESGESLYQGAVELHWDADKDEQLRVVKNHSKTHVYRMDFHDFDRPGVYRVYVEGIGVSYPLRIGDNVWRDAFRVSMHGVLSHRSGIELGPPLTEYRRPRPLHPEDGTRPLQTDVTAMQGGAGVVRESLDRLVDLETQRTPEVVPEAWGGYMDAGDWDARSEHLDVTYLMLELLEMFPDYFGELMLDLPLDERENALPDILDEALWNLDLYRRLQLPTGGVRGGVEMVAHPRFGETSWQNSLLVGVYQPDPMASYRFASTAAKASRALRPFDQAVADEYLDAAIRAYGWARQHEAEHLERSNNRSHQRIMPRLRDLASAELLWTSGDSEYHRRLEADDALTEESLSDNRKLSFTYFRMPEGLTHGAHRESAQKAIIRNAETAIEFGDQNTWGITTASTGSPMMGYVGYWSVPEMQRQVLLRAHFLTGEDRYLSAAVRAANYSSGANPLNRTYTTGLGHNPPRAVNHMDSRTSGQEAPAGITVYGQTDPAMDMGAINWFHQWHLSKAQYPDSRSWPAHEAYVDAHKWPAMTEYTIHQTIGRVTYYWGYLAARSASSAPAPREQ